MVTSCVGRAANAYLKLQKNPDIAKNAVSRASEIEYNHI